VAHKTHCRGLGVLVEHAAVTAAAAIGLPPAPGAAEVTVSDGAVDANSAWAEVKCAAPCMLPLHRKQRRDVQSFAVVLIMFSCVCVLEDCSCARC
jgi:hypothetical protein